MKKKKVISVGNEGSKKLSARERDRKVQKLTKWKLIEKVDENMRNERCPICLDDYGESRSHVVILSCDKKCSFHRDCIVKCYNAEKDFIKCPCCYETFGVEFGPMPRGTMTIEFFKRSRLTLSGYNCGSIRIVYNFPSGTQRKNHPHPGQGYQGTSRTAFLPDNEIGRKVLEKLIICFKRRHSFRIGRSVTNNTDNCVVWNGVHHKTNRSGGFASFGYPDESYFDRVLSELWHKGIK